MNYIVRINMRSKIYITDNFASLQNVNKHPQLSQHPARKVNSHSYKHPPTSLQSADSHVSQTSSQKQGQMLCECLCCSSQPISPQVRKKAPPELTQTVHSTSSKRCTPSCSWQSSCSHPHTGCKVIAGTDKPGYQIAYLLVSWGFHSFEGKEGVY